MNLYTVVTVAIDTYQDGIPTGSVLGAWSTEDPTLTGDESPTNLLDGIRGWLGHHYHPASVEAVRQAWEQRCAVPPWEQLELF